MIVSAGSGHATSCSSSASYCHSHPQLQSQPWATWSLARQGWEPRQGAKVCRHQSQIRHSWYLHTSLEVQSLGDQGKTLMHVAYTCSKMMPFTITAHALRLTMACNRARNNSLCALLPSLDILLEIFYWKCLSFKHISHSYISMLSILQSS